MHILHSLFTYDIYRNSYSSLNYKVCIRTNCKCILSIIYCIHQRYHDKTKKPSELLTSKELYTHSKIGNGTSIKHHFKDLLRRNFQGIIQLLHSLHLPTIHRHFS